MTWATVRRNLFIDPRGTFAPGVWGCYSTHRLEKLVDSDGTPWVRSIRTGGGDGRAIEMLCGNISPATDYRLVVTIRTANVLDPLKISLRGDVQNSSTGTDVATLVLPAGTTTIDVVGRHNGGNTKPAFVMNTVFDPVGNTVDFRAVLIELAPGTGVYFDGSAPNPSETERYIWEDTVDQSVSDDQVYTPVDPNPDGGPRYAPTIKINGTPIPCDFEPDGQNPVVMDGIEIEWGRDALYDPTNPSELRFDLIDPLGTFASDPALFGAPITVETPLGVLFRGRIDAVSIKPGEARDVNPNVPVDVWNIQISATDVIASLAKLVLPGYEHGDPANPYNIQYVKDYGPGYWSGFDTEYRRRQIEDRWQERGIPTRLHTKDFAAMVPPGTPNVSGWQEYFREGIIPSGDDMYTLAQAVIHRGNRPFFVNYMPADDILEPGDWPPASWLELVYEDGLIKIVPREVGDETNVVDCTLVEIVEPGAVESTVTHNIASLRVNERFGAFDPKEGPPVLSENVKWVDDVIDWPIDAPGGGAAQYEPPVKIGVPWDYVSVGVPQDGKQYAALLEPYINSVNGRMVPPDFIFDLEQPTADGEPAFSAPIEEALMATWGVKVPWAFPGNRYEPLTGFGPTFQLIGGGLSYHQGWRIRGRFAPNPVEDESTLTLDQLVTAPDRLLSEFAPNVMLTHLAGVDRSHV